MKARRRIKGHRWFTSGGGCSCGQVHNETNPKTEEDRRMAGRAQPEVRWAEDPKKSVAPKKRRSGSKGKAASARWEIEMRAERCHYCGGPGGTIDHIIPRSKGGPNTASNCVPACGPCNNFRGVQPYDAFKEFGWKSRPFALGI